MKTILVGIDLGGTNIKIGCFDPQLNLVGKISASADVDMGPQAVVDKITQTTGELLQRNGLSIDSIKAAGIGSPGPLSVSDGLIIASPNMPAFKNVPLRDMLADSLKTTVILENDANAACWGEYVLGAGRDIKDMVFFTLGTGIGGGIISDGRLVHGSADNAAELGHIIIYPNGRLCGCGQRGCVEAYASASSTARRAAEAIEAGAASSLKEVIRQNGQITCRDIYEHLKAGDKLAVRITDETAMALALVCVNMLHTTEPQRIVFAGGMTAAGDILLKRIRHYFNENIWTMKKETVEICFAALGEDAGIAGSAALAKQAVEKSE